jgi:hypothetical protein
MSEWWDRLAQRWTEELTEPVMPGRYRARDGAGEPKAIVPVDGEQALVDDATLIVLPSFGVGDEDGYRSAISACADLAPPGIEQDPFASPLALTGVATVPIDALERAHTDTHHCLERVMQTPSSLLRRELEVVPTHRGGRVTSQTVRRLSGHSEDWLTRFGSQVRPWRIQVQRNTVELNRHENRVTVGVAVDLQRHYEQRLRKAEDNLRLVDDASHMDRLSTWQRGRCSELWADGVRDLDLEGHRLGGRRRQLLERKLEVLALRISTLGVALPWLANHEVLQETNLFREHDGYAGVARLWRIARSGVARDPRTRFREAAVNEAAFDRYTHVLTRRAVSILPLMEPDTPRLLAGCVVTRKQDGSVLVEATAIDGRVRRAIVIGVPRFLADVESPLMSSLREQSTSDETAIITVVLGDVGGHLTVASGRTIVAAGGTAQGLVDT